MRPAATLATPPDSTYASIASPCMFIWRKSEPFTPTIEPTSAVVPMPPIAPIPAAVDGAGVVAAVAPVERAGDVGATGKVHGAAAVAVHAPRREMATRHRRMRRRCGTGSDMATVGLLRKLTLI